MQPAPLPTSVSPPNLGLLNDAREKAEQLIDILHQPYAGTEKKPRTYRNRARKDFLSVARNRKPGKNVLRNGLRKQLQYLRRNLAYIEDRVERHGRMVLPKALYRKLLVVSEVYRQQEERYRLKTHSLPSRIVSISQPQVRPSIRAR